MPIDFPSSPNPNDTYLYQSTIWVWNGSAWAIQSTAIGSKGQKEIWVILAPKDQQAHREQRVSRESNFDLWFAPSAVDPNDTNQVKNAYLYVKSIANGEFVGSIDV